MKKLKNNQLNKDFELLNVDIEDILEEMPVLQEYKNKIEKMYKPSISLEELVNLQISLNHVHSHCVDGVKIIEKLLDNLENETA